jgi:hypothetical protein
MLKIVLVALGIFLGLVLVDRVLLRMESRGWIFYRRTKRRGGGALTSAFWAEGHSAFNPGFHEAVEVAVEETKEQDDSGDPPSREEIADDPPTDETDDLALRKLPSGHPMTEGASDDG